MIYHIFHPQWWVSSKFLQKIKQFSLQVNTRFPLNTYSFTSTLSIHLHCMDTGNRYFKKCTYIIEAWRQTQGHYWSNQMKPNKLQNCSAQLTLSEERSAFAFICSSIVIRLPDASWMDSNLTAADISVTLPQLSRTASGVTSSSILARSRPPGEWTRWPGSI